MEGFLVFVPLLIGLVGVGIAVWVTKLYEKKRTETLAVVAEELGMVFSAEQDHQLLSALQAFPLFNKGRAREMKNVMTAETEDTKLAIFEYKYTTGGGKNSQTHKFTLAFMQRATLQLPHFTVRPEGFLDRMGSAMGFQDIDFEEHPEFSRSFVLQGENETAIRAFFDKRIKDLFVGKRDALVEAGGNMMTFRKKGRQSPEKIADFMGEAYEFLNAFEGQTA